MVAAKKRSSRRGGRGRRADPPSSQRPLDARQALARIRHEESRRLGRLLAHAREHGRLDSREDVERALELDAIVLDAKVAPAGGG